MYFIYSDGPCPPPGDGGVPPVAGYSNFLEKESCSFPLRSFHALYGPARILISPAGDRISGNAYLTSHFQLRRSDLRSCLLTPKFPLAEIGSPCYSYRMKKPELANGEFYHVYNRGVEKRIVFPAKEYYARFLKGLSEFNDFGMVELRERRASPPNAGDRISGIKRKKIPLVTIHAFCLMPNHFHLLLEQVTDNGISLFMQKLGVGYTMYFNILHERVGSLFQGKFKAKHIEDDVYLTHLMRYIHLNPVELIEKEWKRRGIKDWKKVKTFLCQNYPWSSHNDYLGVKKYPHIVSTKFLLTLLDGPSGYKDFFQSWLTKDSDVIGELTLE